MTVWSCACVYLCAEVKVRFSVSTHVGNGNEMNKKKHTHTHAKNQFDCLTKKGLIALIFYRRKFREENRMYGKHECESNTNRSLFSVDFGWEIKAVWMSFHVFKSYIRIYLYAYAMGCHLWQLWEKVMNWTNAKVNDHIHSRCHVVFINVNCSILTSRSIKIFFLIISVIFFSFPFFHLLFSFRRLFFSGGISECMKFTIY